MPYKEVPDAVVNRLPVYLRTLDNLISREVKIVISKRLSQETGFTAEQIRKDFSFFGAFGTRGSGYDIDLLRDKIKKIIGLHQRIRAILVGAGQLGRALSRYTITKNAYVELHGIFDKDPRVVGEEILGRKIRHIFELPRLVENKGIKMAMLTVPAGEAQGAADFLVKSGITGVLNFAPTTLKVPRKVHMRNVDLTLELLSLTYYIFSGEKEETAYRP